MLRLEESGRFYGTIMQDISLNRQKTFADLSLEQDEEVKFLP